MIGATSFEYVGPGEYAGGAAGENGAVAAGVPAISMAAPNSATTAIAHPAVDILCIK